MTWTKLSDDHSDDCWKLSDAAWRLHAEGLIWSNRKLLDGRLAKDEIARWAKHPEAAQELLEAAVWADRGEHFEIVHAIEHQPTRDQVMRRRKANQQNGRRGGRPSQQTDSDVAGIRGGREITDSQTQPETDSITEPQSESITESVPETQSQTESPPQIETHRDGTGWVLPSSESSGEGAVPQSGTELEEPLADSTNPPYRQSANGNTRQRRPRCARHAHIESDADVPNCPRCGALRIAALAEEEAETQRQVAERDVRRRAREQCQRCGGTGLVDVDFDDNTVARCPDCSTAGRTMVTTEADR